MVRVRKGYFDLDSTPSSVTAKAPAQPQKTSTPAARLRESILAAYPVRNLPILNSVDYYDVAGKGAMASTAIQIPAGILAFGEKPDGKIQGIIDLSAVYFG